jgi:hypothetical protein
MPSKTGRELLPTYRNIMDGYKCKTKTAMVGYVLKQQRKGEDHFRIVIEDGDSRNHDARLYALAKAFHEKRVNACTHGGTIIIESIKGGGVEEHALLDLEVMKERLAAKKAG